MWRGGKVVFEEMTRLLKILLGRSKMPGLLKIWIKGLRNKHHRLSYNNNRVLSNTKTLQPGRYFRGMQAGEGITNITHGRNIITVCYQTEKTSMWLDIFEGCRRERKQITSHTVQT